MPGVIVDRAQLALIASGGNHRDDPVCKAVSSTVVISPENQLWLPCYHFKHESLPIENNLYDLYKTSAVVAQAREREGRHEFCEGCTVYCYMRNSLMWRYPGESVLMFGHYLRERVRQRIRNVFISPQTTAHPPTPDAPAQASPPPAGEPASAAADRRRLPVVGA
jgi:hypothetical protein